MNDPVNQTDPEGLAPVNPSAIDPATGVQVGRFIVDSAGNVMIEPAGGSMSDYPPGSGNADTHTYYPNGSNYQRLNPNGHVNDPTPHGHGHLQGTGPFRKGQGPSIDTSGNVVGPNCPKAHWPINPRGLAGKLPGYLMIPSLVLDFIEFNKAMNGQACEPPFCV